MAEEYRGFSAKITKQMGILNGHYGMIYHVLPLDNFKVLENLFETKEQAIKAFRDAVDYTIALHQACAVTLQQALKLASKKKLVGVYIDKYVDPMTIKRVGLKQVKHKVKKYIKWLKHLPVKESNLVTFVNHQVATDFYNFSQVKPDFNIQKLGDVGNYENRYDIILMPASEALGIRIVPTKLTQHYHYELLAYLMYQINWTGWRQEHLGEEIERLDKAVKETENDHGKTYSMEEIEKVLGYDRRKQDNLDSYEYQRSRKMRDLAIEIWMHSYKKEARKVRKYMGLIK